MRVLTVNLVHAVDHAVGRRVDAGRAQERGEPVGDVHDVVADLPGADVAGPAHDAGCPQIALPAGELRAFPVAGGAAPRQHLLGAVVAGEHDRVSSATPSSSMAADRNRFYFDPARVTDVIVRPGVPKPVFPRLDLRRLQRRVGAVCSGAEPAPTPSRARAARPRASPGPLPPMTERRQTA